MECVVKYAGPTVIVQTASGERRSVDIRTFRLLREAGAFWKVIQRKRDKAITRGLLRAEPNEIATRITAQAEVVQVLPTTWTHRSSLAAGY